MTMIHCHECKAEMSDTAAACPKCGARPMQQPGPKLWLWIPLTLVVGFVGMVFIAGAPEPTPRDRDRQAIELCWKDRERKSLDPHTKRLMAAMCEEMESRFVSKWNSRP